MSYFQVVELFCRLYEQTDYGNEIKKTINRLLGEPVDEDNNEFPKEKMLLLMEKNCNFYRALYRANILYFSLYVGKQFEEFLIENEIYKKNDKMKVYMPLLRQNQTEVCTWQDSFYPPLPTKRLPISVSR